MADLLSIEDVAARLKIKPRTVLEWLRTGKLAGYKMGRIWRVDPADVDAFLAQHKQPAKEAPAAEVGMYVRAKGT